MTTPVTPSPAEAPEPVAAPRPESRGFRRELTPTWLSTATLLAGHRPPDFARPFRAAYLGLGTGETAAVVAAVHPHSEVWAWDFRPAPVETTRRLRDAAGLRNLVVHERPTLPSDLGGDSVDLVVVTGVFDAASDELRAQIVDIIGNSLRPGGVACITYKTTVGWNEIAPVTRLMRYAVQRRGVGAVTAVPGVLELLASLRAGGASHLTGRPVVAAWLDELAGCDDATIAVEYLDDELRPCSHAHIAEAVARTGCEYVGSARLTDDLDLAVPPALVDVVADAPTSLLSEVYRDLAVRRTTRADVFRLGAASLSPAECEAALRARELVGLARDALLPGDLESVVEAQLDSGPVRVSDLDFGGESTERAVRLVLDAGRAHPTIPGGVDAAAATAGKALDALVREPGPEGGGVRVAPLIGSAIPARTGTDERLLARLGVA